MRHLVEPHHASVTALSDGEGCRGDVEVVLPCRSIGAIAAESPNEDAGVIVLQAVDVASALLKAFATAEERWTALAAGYQRAPIRQR